MEHAGIWEEALVANRGQPYADALCFPEKPVAESFAVGFQQ